MRRNILAFSKMERAGEHTGRIYYSLTAWLAAARDNIGFGIDEVPEDAPSEAAVVTQSDLGDFERVYFYSVSE